MRHYKRKTDRGSTPLDIMERAAQCVIGGQSMRNTAKQFNIDRMTLKRFISKMDDDQEPSVGYSPVSKRQLVLPSNVEKDLATYVRNMSDMFHGLSIHRCCSLAFELATRNNIAVPLSWQINKKAGHDWWLGFKQRYELSVRKPEATSLGRATAFNKPVVSKFFDNLAEVMDKFKFSPSDIYNLDETVCTTVQRPLSVITQRGKKQVGAITSAERGELVTVVYTVSAIGTVVPPLFIFPRVNFKEHFTRGGPTDCIGRASRSGWMLADIGTVVPPLLIIPRVNFKEHFTRGGPTDCIGRASRSGWMLADIFVEYLKHLVKHTKCSTDKKILLIVENHDTHISLEAIDTAKANGIVLLTIPPHTSHRLQPLDCSVYGPFKSAYNRALDGWVRSNPGKTVSIYEIPALVNQAQMVAVTAANIVAGFRITGIKTI